MRPIPFLVFLLLFVLNVLELGSVQAAERFVATTALRFESKQLPATNEAAVLLIDEAVDQLDEAHLNRRRRQQWDQCWEFPINNSRFCCTQSWKLPQPAAPVDRLAGSFGSQAQVHRMTPF